MGLVLPRTPLSRREFCALATCAAAGLAPTPKAAGAEPTRLNLAQIDRDRILAAAAKALERPVKADKDAQSEAFLALTLDIPALAAANLITPDPRFAAGALAHLNAWFATPETRLPASATDPGSVLLTAPLAELAVALPFLGLAPEADSPNALAPLRAWFADYLTWLTESRIALLARDARDHNGSSWLLQVAAYARLTGPPKAADDPLAEGRHRFKTVTVRAQIDANGLFKNELPTPNPFRNSLLNLDLLAGACILLSTPFDSVWVHELQDGPGMRAAIARFAPYIANPSTWPYPADQAHFHDLPARRPALLFAARAYSHAEYATLWRTLNPDPTQPEILRAFPIRQPILWQSQPRPAI